MYCGSSSGSPEPWPHSPPEMKCIPDLGWLGSAQLSGRWWGHNPRFPVKKPGSERGSKFPIVTQQQSPAQDQLISEMLSSHATLGASEMRYAGIQIQMVCLKTWVQRSELSKHRTSRKMQRINFTFRIPNM